MRKALAFVLALGLGCALLASGTPSAAAQDEYGFEPYTAEQLDNLLAPIALYPDPLLAQVLVAATFVDQIDLAARWVRSYGQNGVDAQPWDVSVRAVAHYPAVLDMMDDNLDWTTAVGQAYVYQSTDVMASIQRLRAMARAQGNLVTTPQQQVVVEGGSISIWPASPAYLYVPTYDPAIVFFRPAYVGGVFTAFSFGPALTIGVWLNLDCDWSHRRIYYTGWRGGGWIARSRSHVRMNARYVNPRFSTIVVNRRVVQRTVNYRDLSRYHAVHRAANFDNRARGVPRGVQETVRPSEGRALNKIIDRNIPPQQRLDQFRGRQQPGPAPAARPLPQPSRSAPMPARPAQQPRATPPPRQLTPTPAPRPRGTPSAPPPRATPAAPPPRATPAAPRARATPAAPPPRATPSAPRSPNAFGGPQGPFNSRTASQRGRQSREQMRQAPAGKPRSQGQQRQGQPRGRQP